IPCVETARPFPEPRLHTALRPEQPSVRVPPSSPCWCRRELTTALAISGMADRDDLEAVAASQPLGDDVRCAWHDQFSGAGDAAQHDRDWKVQRRARQPRAECQRFDWRPSDFRAQYELLTLFVKPSRRVSLERLHRR